MPNKPETVDIHTLSPVTLAYLGDGVMELLVRTRIVQKGNRSPGALHREASRIVSAHGQFTALQHLQPQLTEEEANVVRRGRNATKVSVAKNATAQEYRASTGLEALFGWLYLQGRHERIQELFEQVWQHHQQ